jgi:hypothetical protein
MSLNSATLDALTSFPQQLALSYAAIPADYKTWSPSSWEGIPSESFTAIEHLSHVRDIEEAGYHQRFRRALTQVNPSLEPLEGYSLAKEHKYADAKAEDVLAAFRTVRAETVQLLSGLTQTQLNRTATFNGYGIVTINSLVHYLCSHNQQHLAGLQWLLGKIEAEPKQLIQ